MNKVILMGNVGKDPELRYTPGGSGVANFSLATTERFTSNGEKQEKTEWHNIVVWGKLAEVVNQYVKKGSKLLVEGKIQTRSWEANGGEKKYRTEIHASHFEFCGGAQQREETRW